MLMHKRFLTASLLPLLFLLFAATEAVAQVPDTTYRKPELPTGPPVPVEQPRQQQRQQAPQQPSQPKPVEEPQVEQQEPEEQLRFVDRLYFGGSFGLQFGSYTSISLLPTLSYAITPKYYLGVGAVYHFNSSSYGSFHHYGGRVFNQLEMFSVGDGAVLAHAELEILSVESELRFVNGQSDRSGITMPMIGLGYRQRISEKGSLDLLVLYNTNDEPNNPYSNPVIRLGFNFPLTSR